jgi:predicted dehydrogenase
MSDPGPPKRSAVRDEGRRLSAGKSLAGYAAPNLAGMTYRWGIIGSGGIAATMTETLQSLPDTEVVAVVSPTEGRADAFGDEHDIDLRFHHPSDVGGNVDVAYVGSANHRHYHDTMALIDIGVPVLCEKSLALNASDAQHMADHARANGVFLMEAMWMRFQPFWDQLVDRIQRGSIGDLRRIDAEFSAVVPTDPGRRWFDPAQGGGALLDVVVYSATFARDLAGDPLSIEATGRLADTGADAAVEISMTHPNGVISRAGGSYDREYSVTATVFGDAGHIDLQEPFHHTPGFSVYRDDHLVEEVDTSYEGSGYRWEVEEVHRCLEQGLTESPVRPLDDTLATMRILDEARLRAFGS